MSAPKEPVAELEGWKVIAAHLGVSVRTAQKLEKTSALPVKHEPGVKGRVFASKADLDDWKARRGHGSARAQDPPQRYNTGQLPASRFGHLPVAWQRLVIGSASAVLLIAISSLVIANLGPPREPSRIRLSGRVLEMLDQKDSIMWQYTLPGTPSPLPVRGCYECSEPLIADVDGDGSKELLYSFHNLDIPEQADTLYCFGAKGEVRWIRQIGRELKTRSGQPYARHYNLFWIKTLHRPTPSGGIVVVSGRRGGTSLFCVELLNRDGKMVGEYYHPGWLWANTVRDLDQDGYDEIILGGVNNAYGALPGFNHPMTLVVLDSKNVHGEGPAPESDSRHFAGLSAGNERAVLFFREFGQLPTDSPSWFCLFDNIWSAGRHIQAHAHRLGSNEMAVDYQFNEHLNLEFAIPSPAVGGLLTSKLSQSLTPSERTEFYMRALGDIKVLKNDFAVR